MCSEQKRIGVVHYCNQLSLGGTERTLEIFCRYLNKKKYDVHAVCMPHEPSFSEKLKVYVGAFFGHKSAKAKLTNWKNRDARLPRLKKILGSDHVHVTKNATELTELIIENLRPEILHIHYSGRAEPPTSVEAIMNFVPTIVTTNQFELENTSPFAKKISRIFLVSNWLRKNKAEWSLNDPRAKTFYNPIEKPFSKDNLRLALNIPQNAFVIGRIGRPDNGIHDSISLKAYKEIQGPDTFFIALSPPPRMIEEAKELELKNFIALKPTTDEVELSKFYNTIDVLAHARRDGETFGCNLAEAMMHGKPCVSHLCDFMNAQTEIVGPGGTVVKKDDSKSYAAELLKLKNDPNYYSSISTAAKKHAEESFEATMLVSVLENEYDLLRAQRAP